MFIANCPFNKMKILSEATIGLEKSFPIMYSNIGLNSRETVPLKLTIHSFWDEKTFILFQFRQTFMAQTSDLQLQDDVKQGRTNKESSLFLGQNLIFV